MSSHGRNIYEGHARLPDGLLRRVAGYIENSMKLMYEKLAISRADAVVVSVAVFDPDKVDGITTPMVIMPPGADPVAVATMLRLAADMLMEGNGGAPAPRRSARTDLRGAPGRRRPRKR